MNRKADTNLLLLLGLILFSATPSCAQNKEGRQSQYTHILAWGSWNGAYDANDFPQVLLDKQTIGSVLDASHKLETLDIGPRDKIKVEIPIVTDLNFYSHRPIYSFGNFLYIWLNKGAHLYFFQGGKAFKLHTLTWSDYRDEKGLWKDDLTTAHLILDNKDIGQVDIGLGKLRRMTWEDNTLLQLYFPYANAPQPMLLMPKGLDDVLKSLSKGGRVLVENIPCTLSESESTP